MFFILREGLNSLSNILNLADVQLAEIRKKCLLITNGLLGPLQFCRVTIVREVREFRLLLLEVVSAISSIFVLPNSSNVFLCSKSVASASAISLFISTRNLFQYTRYFTTLTGILREILAGSLELYER